MSMAYAKPRANAVLAALPERELELLRPELEHVPLELKLTIQEPERPLSHLWFPHSGVLSVLSEMSDGTSVEVATIGRESVAGLTVVLGTSMMAQRVIAQIPGEAERLPVNAYERLRNRLQNLELLLLRCAAGLVTQIAQGSACNRLHAIEARCARWLLLTHDRVDGDEFPLTHEFLAQMLGVTRPSVTIAAGILQKAGLITYARGIVSIVDRQRLEDASCECYRIVTDEFRRLITRPS
jgi:CRP-like cAMP-binding protein